MIETCCLSKLSRSLNPLLKLPLKPTWNTFDFVFGRFYILVTSKVISGQIPAGDSDTDGNFIVLAHLSHWVDSTRNQTLGLPHSTDLANAPYLEHVVVTLDNEVKVHAPLEGEDGDALLPAPVAVYIAVQEDAAHLEVCAQVERDL